MTSAWSAAPSRFAPATGSSRWFATGESSAGWNRQRRKRAKERAMECRAPRLREARTGPPQKEPPADHRTLEAALHTLERMVRELEDGQLGLDEALGRYEEGVGPIKNCHSQLRQAEQRILLLTGIDEQGRPVLRPLEH